MAKILDRQARLELLKAEGDSKLLRMALGTQNKKDAAMQKQVEDFKKRMEFAVKNGKMSAEEAKLAIEMAQGWATSPVLSDANDALEKEKAKADRDARKIKEHNAEMRRKKSEKKAQSAERTRLLNIMKRLDRMKTTQANRALYEEIIGEFDLVAKSITGDKLDDLRALQEKYDELSQDPDFIRDPATEEKLKRLGKKHIKDLNIAEVRDLTEALMNIENEIRTSKKFIDSAINKATFEAGESIIEDLKHVKGRGNGFTDWLNTNSLSPVRMIHRMTGYNDASALNTLTQELAEGQRKMIRYQQDASNLFTKWTSDRKLTDSLRGKNAETVKVEAYVDGKPTQVEVTRDMALALYLHAMNDQNLLHIEKGGVTIPDMDLLRRGKTQKAYDNGIQAKIAPSIMRGIGDMLTSNERAFANAVSKYYNTTSKSAINTVSEQLKGYSLAQVENYFPIETDSDFTKNADIGELKRDGTIEGMGILKERVNAANPIMLRGMTEILEKSIGQHAKYVGLAIPVRNFGKVWKVSSGSFTDGPATNVTQRTIIDGNGNESSYEAYAEAVAKSVRKKWESRGVDAVEKMLSDLQNSNRHSDELDSVFGKLRSNYAGAVLTLNLSVALKQAASFPTAGYVLGGTPLIKAMPELMRSVVGMSSVDEKLIQKYTPLLWYRSQGWSNQELGDLKNRGKQLPKPLNWIQHVDIATTKALWKASEYYVNANLKDMKRGTDEYYKAVAEVYNRVIEETQPNYTTMQRPQLLRSDSTLVQNIMMFKTQPLQNYGILYDSIENLKAKTADMKDGKATKQQVDMARRDVGRAVSSQVLQLAVFASMTALWNFIRRKKDKYADDEGNVTAKSAAVGIGKDMASGAAGMVPFGTEVFEAMNAMYLGEKYYGMDAASVTALNDMVTTGIEAEQYISKLIQKMEDGDDVDAYEVTNKMIRYAGTISNGLGVPLNNVVNLIDAGYHWGAVMQAGVYAGEYGYSVHRGKMSKSAAVDLSLDARNAGENAEADIIEQDLIDRGEYANREELEKAILERKRVHAKIDKQYDALWKLLKDGDINGYKAEQKKMLDSGLVDNTAIAAKMRSKKEAEQKKNKFFLLSFDAMNLIADYDQYYKNMSDKFTPDDLNAEQYQSFEAERSKTYAALKAEASKLPSWNAGAETRQKVENKLETYAKESSLENNSNGIYTSSTEWIGKAQDALNDYGISVAKYIDISTRGADIESIKDSKDEAVTVQVSYINDKGARTTANVGSTSLEKMLILYDSDLTDQQRKAMMDYLNIAKSVRKLNRSAIESKLEKIRKQAGK